MAGVDPICYKLLDKNPIFNRLFTNFGQPGANVICKQIPQGDVFFEYFSLGRLCKFLNLIFLNLIFHNAKCRHIGI